MRVLGTNSDIDNGCYMKLYTLNELPESVEIVSLFDLVSASGVVRVPNTSIKSEETFDDSDSQQKILNSLIEKAPHGANAIIGIKLSSAIDGVGNGISHKHYLFHTYIGTPAVIIDKSA